MCMLFVREIREVVYDIFYNNNATRADYIIFNIIILLPTCILCITYIVPKSPQYGIQIHSVCRIKIEHVSTTRVFHNIIFC